MEPLPRSWKKSAYKIICQVTIKMDSVKTTEEPSGTQKALRKPGDTATLTRCCALFPLRLSSRLRLGKRAEQPVLVLISAAVPQLLLILWLRTKWKVNGINMRVCVCMRSQPPTHTHRHTTTVLGRRQNPVPYWEKMMLKGAVWKKQSRDIQELFSMK